MDLGSFVKCPSLWICSGGRIVESSVQLLKPAVMVEMTFTVFWAWKSDEIAESHKHLDVKGLDLLRRSKYP